MVKSKFYNLDTDITLSSNSDYYVPSEKAIKAYADTKQAELVSGTNIKTINNESILGSGNISIPVFIGATASTAGVAGLVPAPVSGEVGKYLKSDGTWDTVSGGGAVNSVNGYTGTVVLTAGDLNITEYTANEVQTLWEAN